MKRFFLACFILLIFQMVAVFAQTAKTYEFTNGNWFDGKTFRAKKMYSFNGIFTDRKPEKIDETIDLQNGFVIPPFADAHTHHFDSEFSVAQHVPLYLKDGVFYAKVQTDVRSTALKVKNKLNLPTSVDVSFAHGALTHTYGHGIEIYEALALGYYYDLNLYKSKTAEIAASRIRNNDAYYIIDTAEDLENKWQKILDGKPDFIKIYLLTSEEFEEKRKNIPNIPLGSIGLDPKLVPAIVRKAHQAGLRVSAHVDTATDFRIALNAGVDEMAHIPGYYVDAKDDLKRVLLTEKDAKEAAKRKTWVVPAPIFYGEMSPETRSKTDEGLKANLGLLKKHKVKIAFGSDSYGRSPMLDVFHLQTLGIFSNLELLKIWTENTPRTIFPNRRIGFLKNGYEASFIVLQDNPIKDFTQIKNIKFRFKQGVLLK